MNGPLPKDDANARLQRRSLAVFNERVSQDMFIVRQETVCDYGVDIVVEAVLDENPLNYRSQIQLKGRSGLSPNTDGRYALSVETSNLNYLLHGDCPFYVLFRPEDESLWYVSARSEEVRLAAENSRWRGQKTITLYLSERLDQAGFKCLYDAINRTGAIAADILSALHALTPGSAGKFAINLAKTKIDTEASALDFISSNGILMVAAGESERVIELSSLLSTENQRRPEVLLALAYAQYCRGRHKNAEVYLADLDLAELSDENRSFAEFLELAAATASGRVSAEEFAEKVELWAIDAESAEQTQYRLLAQHKRANSVAGHERRKELDLLHRMASRAAEDDSLPPLVRAFGRRYVLEIESERLANELTRYIAFSRQAASIQEYVYGGRSAEEVVGASMARIVKWETEVSSLLKFAEESGHQPLRCGVLYTRELGRSILLISLSNAARRLPRKSAPTFPTLLGESGARARLEEVISLAKKLNETGLYLLGRLLLVRLLDRADLPETKTEASRLAREATLHGLPNIGDEARDIAAGRSLYREMRLEEAREEAMSPDARLVAMGDDAVSALARGLCESLNLPEDRIPVAADEIQAMRFYAARRHDWCKHVEYLQDKAHTASSETYYRSSPKKKARCRLLGVESVFPNADAVAVFGAFQGANCQGCSHRAPSDSGVALSGETGG